jgi:hypothetical protein
MRAWVLRSPLARFKPKRYTSEATKSLRFQVILLFKPGKKQKGGKMEAAEKNYA